MLPSGGFKTQRRKCSALAFMEGGHACHETAVVSTLAQSSCCTQSQLEATDAKRALISWFVWTHLKQDSGVPMGVIVKL
jgi:hypothetical protein